MKWPIRLRLTLWYSVVMAAGLAVFSIGVLWLHARWGQAQFDSELTSLGAATARVMQEELGESGNLRRAVTETDSSMDVPERATAILDRGGMPMAAHWHGFRYNHASFTPDAAAQRRIATVDDDGRSWRVLLRHESSQAGDYVILVAGPLQQLGRQHQLLSRVLLIVGPLFVFVTAAVCWWVASSALRPVTMMAAQAEAITIRSASWRLDTPDTADELSQLARAFNRLLARLGAASQIQREFMADASHELRTPVSVIQTAAEVTLGERDRQEWEYREALTIVNEQSTRLGRMVDDMLVLARAEANRLPLHRRLVYVDEIVAECARAVSVVSATKGVQLVMALEPDVSISADDRLLRQLVTNLLDNAVQHTPRGGVVTAAVTSDRSWAIITVSDTGPGVPPADRDRIFERFVRLDPARSSTSGAGLGLPIARWVAEQHGGTLTVQENASGGCLFVAELPRRGTPAVDVRTADALEHMT